MKVNSVKIGVLNVQRCKNIFQNYERLGTGWRRKEIKQNPHPPSKETRQTNAFQKIMYL